MSEMSTIIQMSSQNNKNNQNNQNSGIKDIGVLLIHQGTTDIINIFGLIKYYSKKYKLYIFSLKKNENLLNFYCKNLDAIIIIYENMYDINIYSYSHIKQDYSHIIHNNNCHYLFHGFHDIDRNDNYKNNFSKTPQSQIEINFVNLFYSSYDIPISVRIDYFIFERDHELENRTYDNFIQEHGDKYILYHSNDNFFINKTDYKCINLNQCTETFFDYIKILENSKEFHLLDSCWGAFIYLLDCKYRLFKDKKIYLYPLRNHTKMFQDPVKLDNWVFV